jgi:Protein of unknown function (DUF1402)
MKHFLTTLIVAASLTPTIAHAERAPVVEHPNEAVAAEFQRLCSYDTLCSKVGSVRSGRLFYKLPSPAIMPYYQRLRSKIIQIAAEYKIDPVALALAPIAENTMNVKKDKQYKEALGDEPVQGDAYQEMLDDKGLLDDDGAPIGLNLFYSRPLSLGPGQIYVSVANSVEPLAALIENRPTRTKKEIKKQIRTPEGALRYAAAIIREAQEVYARGGIDISQRPDILVTLYNIGKPKQRLSRTLSDRRLPSPNYFGYFAKLNYGYVKSELRLP